MEAKGSKLLKVSSILMIIGGIAGAVLSVLMVALAGASTAMLSDESIQQSIAEAGTTTGTVSAVLWVAAIFIVIASVVEIVAGFKGKNNWNNPTKAQTLLGLGIACAVLSLIGNIMFASDSGVSIVSILTGLILPVLYIIGTIQLKKQA